VARQEHVGRLDVTVDDPGLVQRAESAEHVPGQGEGLVRRQRSAPQAHGQRLTREQLGGEERPSPVLSDLEDRAHVRVADAGGGAGLAQEPAV
jgi:hypothetical protein